MILPTVGLHQAANRVPASLEKISSWTNACKQIRTVDHTQWCMWPWGRNILAWNRKGAKAFLPALSSGDGVCGWNFHESLLRSPGKQCPGGPTLVLDVQLNAGSISGNPTPFSMQGASCSFVYFLWICKIKMKSWESLATTPVSAKSSAVTPPVQVVCYDFFSSARPRQKRDLNHAPLLMKLHFSSPGTFATYSPLTMPSVDWTIASDFFTSSGSDPSA